MAWVTFELLKAHLIISQGAASTQALNAGQGFLPSFPFIWGSAPPVALTTQRLTNSKGRTESAAGLLRIEIDGSVRVRGVASGLIMNNQAVRPVLFETTNKEKPLAP